MFKALFATLKLSLFTFACLLTSPAIAQVTTDGTVGTQVNQNENVAEITGGESRGNNLFHSFQDFSVQTGNEAFFDNADNVSNIFSRVTGGNISDIDGAIRANGSASLFLINPAGIVFGENASLDIGGSFYGSTASSVLFEDGEFSAVDNLQQPILTVNAPIGLGFRDNPGEIVNRSRAESSIFEDVAGLEVSPRNSLALVGGNINFEAGKATARSGNINLGGLSQAGIVEIDRDGNFSFPENVAKADVSLSNNADVNVEGIGGGNIAINAQNLSLEAGELGSSFIRAGIFSDPSLTNAETQAGNITIDVAENITLSDSGILNQVVSGSLGNSGNITISTSSLEASNGGQVVASTGGQGNAGSVDVSAVSDISIDGDSEGFFSGISSRVLASGEGDSAGVTISTTNLNMTNGGRVNASAAGNGSAGAIDITATGDITVDGGINNSTTGIASVVGTGEGDSAGVTISTTNLNLINGGSVNTNTLGNGNAGAINISTTNINLTNGGSINASTSGTGNAGTVNVTATGDITVNGEEDSDGLFSGIFSGVDSDAEGDSGGVTISTTNLNLINGGRVNASTFGQGNAGAVNVTATGDITVDGGNSQGFISGIFSEVNSNAEGDSGGVTISTANLNLMNGGQVNASTSGRGNAGAINVSASGNITADGENSDSFFTGILSQVDLGAEGDAEGITISTSDLNLTNGGQIDASTFSRGNAGAINITATGNIMAQGVSSGITSIVRGNVSGNGEGNAGGVNISTTNLSLTDRGSINTSTENEGNAGAIDIVATGNITIGFSSDIASEVGSSLAIGDAGGITISTTNLNLTEGGEINTSTSGQGDAGGITISTTNLNLTDGADIDASTFGQGNAGEVNITAIGDITADSEDLSFFGFSRITSRVGTDAEGNSGGVTISATNLNLTNGSLIDASTSDRGNAGAVNITVTEDISIDGEFSGIFGNSINSGIISPVNSDAEGDSGGVTISTNNLNLTNGGRVDASTFGQGNAGAVDITATGDITADGRNSNGSSSGITSKVNTNAEGDSGEVTISTTNLNLTDGGLIDASTFSQGNAGAIDVDASESIFISGVEDARVGISANAVIENGNGSNVNVSTERLIIQNNGIIEASNRDFQLDLTPGTGLPGNISIEANTIELNDGAIGAATQSAEGVRGNIDLDVAEGITLRNNSLISAQAFGEADGGNLSIDTNFIVAFSDNNDIIASAERGQGGNININAESLLGIEERPLNPNTNDINASSEFNLDGSVNISSLDINPVRGAAELPTNVIVSEETTQQACASNRGSAAKSGLDITGKGGVVPNPALPLNSLNVHASEDSNSTSNIPAPIATSQGKIQPAMGIKVTKSGNIVLTAHRTNNAGQRIPQGDRNCG